ncbi:MAG: hypothetical protein M1817_006234 [Caeruleum heppii]|nr:MAG: hypothetical protein M1817_006234 [Caeruleum heppii]
MQTAALSVVFFRPRYGNFQHWALHLQTTDDFDHHHITCQVDGSHGTFQARTDDSRPQDDPTYLGRVKLTTINARDIPQFRQVVGDAVVDNETVEWDCQDYILEILDALEEECIVDGEDEEYREAKAEVKGRRGAIL